MANPEAQDSMRRRVADVKLKHLFNLDKRLSGFAFLQADDLVDLGTSAFKGIAEWHAYSEHYLSCELCRA